MKQNFNLFFCFVLLAIFAASCNQPNIAQAQIEEESELMLYMRNIFPLSQTNPDSLFVLLDAMRTENEHRMTANEKVSLYNLLGIIYQERRDFETAEMYLLKALQYLESLDSGDLVRKASVVRNIADTRNIAGNMQSAIDAYRQAIVLLGNYHAPNMLASIYIDKANALISMGETDSALYYTQRAVDIATEENLTNIQTIALMRLAMIFLYHENYSQSEENIRNALPALIKMNNATHLWIAYMNLAHVLAFQNKMEESLYYAQKSDEIAANIGTPPVAMYAWHLRRGLMYVEENNYRSAQAMFYRALELRTMMQDVRMMADVQSVIAQTYIRMGNINQALFFATEALRAAQENGLQRLEMKIQRSLIAIHAARGDMNAVFAAMEAESRLRNELFTEESNRALHDMQVRHDTERTQLQLAQQIEENRRKRITNSFLLFAIIVFVATSVLFFFFQRKKMQRIRRAVQQYETILKLKKIETKHTSAPLSNQKRMIASEISEKLLPEIERLFNEEKIYKRQGLGIDDVAKMLNTNKQYLSIIINEHYQATFPEFVKTYRTDEAIKMFKEMHDGGKFAHYTIQAIAEEAGFTGKSAFNSAFKEITGVTPTEYLKALKATNNKTIE